MRKAAEEEAEHARATNSVNKSGYSLVPAVDGCLSKDLTIQITMVFQEQLHGQNT